MTAQLREPPRDVAGIQAQETGCILPQFTAETAWILGNSLRQRVQQISPTKPAVISITLANSDQLLFFTTTGSGTAPDNDQWVARKRRVVLRWGMSTWGMRHKVNGSEAAFKDKFMLGERAGEYAIHGGGFPVRVQGVEGVVGVIVVSGLKQEEDHQVIVEVLEEYLRQLK